MRTRRAVLAAASETFSLRGYAGTTMRHVAESAAVSVPLVEQLFGTKASLLKACVDVAIAADVTGFLSVVVSVLGPAQAPSATLVLAVFEAAGATRSWPNWRTA